MCGIGDAVGNNIAFEGFKKQYKALTCRKANG